MFQENLKEGNKSSQIYALCRPPGHHATQNFFGGYCYFNNAALAAQLLSKNGRVVVFDVDYHHGNGTQDIFYERNDVYYISIHGDPNTEYPFYSGFAEELGKGEGLNFNKNFPLPTGTKWDNYKPIYEQALEIIGKYNPTYIVVSLGLTLRTAIPYANFT